MKRNQALAFMVVILLLATALRFFRIEFQSFWNDEGNSARLSERSIDLIIEGTASDIHPPLYYLFLRGWRELAGESEFSLRALSAFLGLSLVAVTYALGRQLLGFSGWQAAAAGALLSTINPALVYYSQEARMYEMLALLAVLSTWMLVRLLQRPGWKPGLAIAYILTAAAGLYTHYFFPAVLIAQNLIFLLWLYRRYRKGGKTRDNASWDLHNQDSSLQESSPEDVTAPAPTKPRTIWAELGTWAVIMMAVGLFYLPWLPIFLRQAGGRSISRLPFSQFILESFTWLTYGATIELNDVMVPLFSYALLLLVGIVLAWTVNRRGISFAATLLFCLVMPLALMWLAGATRPAFYKFMLVVAPALCLLVGIGGWRAWKRPTSQGSNRSWLIQIQRTLVIILAGLIAVGSAYSLANMYFNPVYARVDYRGIAAQIAAEDHPKAAIVLNAANQWEVFTYYHTEGAPVFPIPTTYPEPAAIDAELTQIAEQFNRIYALFWGETERDPQRLVERWLDAHAFKARDEWVGDVRFVTYALPAEPIDEMATSSTTQFGDSVVLQGYTLYADKVAPGEILQLALFWQARESLGQRYKVFLHLVNDKGEIVAQRDSEPGGGLVLTSTWQPGETIVDNHGVLIPVGTPPGTYTLLVGLYDVADPTARLPIETDSGEIDALPLSAITVVEE